MFILQSENILAGLRASDKEQVFADLSEMAARSTGLEASVIRQALLAREHSGCTGVGKGFSIPHARFEQLTQPFGLFARLTPAIDFGAADGKPVDLVFLLLSPANRDAEHLKSLALIASILRNPETSNGLRTARDRQDLYLLLSASSHEDAMH